MSRESLNPNNSSIEIGEPKKKVEIPFTLIKVNGNYYGIIETPTKVITLGNIDLILFLTIFKSKTEDGISSSITKLTEAIKGTNPHRTGNLLRDLADRLNPSDELPIIKKVTRARRIPNTPGVARTGWTIHEGINLVYLEPQ